MISVDVFTPSCMIAASCPRRCTNNTINRILGLISLILTIHEEKTKEITTNKEVLTIVKFGELLF